MQVVYEAANSIDAHIVLNMLRAQDIDGRIDGEYLQGGMGELPVAGLVRVLVDDADLAAARSIIQAWDTTDTDNSARQPLAASDKFPRELAIVFAVVFALIIWTWLRHAS